MNSSTNLSVGWVKRPPHSLSLDMVFRFLMLGNMVDDDEVLYVKNGENQSRES